MDAKHMQMKVKGVWGSASEVEPTFVDEMQIQHVGDRAYITFGQVRLPTVNSEGTEQPNAEIRPVVRLVVTQKTLAKMLTVLTRATDESKE